VKNQTSPYQKVKLFRPAELAVQLNGLLLWLLKQRKCI
jgi:hypothetical protein